MAADVEFFFDPVCPFSWQTSRWVEEVRRQRPIEVAWRPISLWLLNEDGEDPDSPMGRMHRRGHELQRIFVAAQESGGAGKLGALYTAVGERIFGSPPPEEPGFEAVANEVAEADLDITGALDEARLSTDLVEAAGQVGTRWDTILRTNTDEAMARAGEDVGTPVLSFDPPDGPAFFGPVISRVPRADEAVEIWEALTTLARFESFAELKRELRSTPEVPLLGNL